MIKKVLIGVLLSAFTVAGAKYHTDSRGAEIHTPFRWVVADSAARVALSVAAADTQKMCFQLADTSIWVLIDNSPKNWAWVSGKKADSLWIRTFQAVTAGVTRMNIDTSHTRSSTAGKYDGDYGYFDSVYIAQKLVADSIYAAKLTAAKVIAPLADVDSMVGDVKTGGNFAINSSTIATATGYKYSRVGNPFFVMTGNASGLTHHASNAYIGNDGVWHTVIAGRATVVALDGGNDNADGDGDIVMYVSDSVAAGAQVTFTEKFRLDKSGNISVANTLTAPSFVGDLDGRADTAGLADSAGKAGTATLADSAGKAGTATNVSGGTMSGTSLTLNSGDPLTVYDTGTVTLTVTGFSDASSISVRYTVVGNVVFISLPYLIATSNALTFTLTGLPTATQPSESRVFYSMWGADNGINTQVYGQVSTSTISFFPTPVDTWTASGVKGIYGAEIMYRK